MSVRDKVKQFETLKDEPARDQTPGKKFLFPGNKQLKKTNEPVVVGIPQTRSKPSILSEFEANLEEVWSVRKNIHHNNNNVRGSNGIKGLNVVVSSSLSVPKFNQGQSYSRHGALGTHQSEALHGIALDNSHLKNRRVPLHDNNTIETNSQARSTRPTGFSLTESTKKHNFDITHNKDNPMTKRKRTFKEGGEGLKLFSTDPTSLFTSDGHVSSDHKVSYAKRMAEAHLKSAGLGEYTPKQSGYSKIEDNDDGKSIKWRKIDDNDEFSF